MIVCEIRPHILRVGRIRILTHFHNLDSIRPLIVQSHFRAERLAWLHKGR
jgi:hypothetical protein